MTTESVGDDRSAVDREREIADMKAIAGVLRQLWPRDWARP